MNRAITATGKDGVESVSTSLLNLLGSSRGTLGSADLDFDAALSQHGGSRFHFG